MSKVYVTVVIGGDMPGEDPGFLLVDGDVPCEVCRTRPAVVEFFGGASGVFQFCLVCAFADGGDIIAIRRQES